MNTEKNTPPLNPEIYNKWAYGGFIGLAILMLLLELNFASAAMYLGLAFIFDPFDTNIPFGERPFYQKAITISQLLLMVSFIVIALVNRQSA